jgi:hypothetical protein
VTLRSRSEIRRYPLSAIGPNRARSLAGPPRETPAEPIYIFFARDPDGYLTAFQRVLDPAWPGKVA